MSSPTTITVLDALAREWAVLATRPVTRRAVARWAETEPALTGCCHLADVLALTLDGGDRAHDVGAALLRLAAYDPLAERTFLEAVRPTLVASAARARWYTDPRYRHSGGWADLDTTTAHALELALVWIRRHAGTTVAWPASRLTGYVRSMLRSAATAEHRRRAVTDRVRTIAPPSNPGLDLDEDAAELLNAAIAAHVITRPDAHLIAATRVLGWKPSELVEHFGASRDTLLRRRHRAETRLRAWLHERNEWAA